MPAAPLKSSDQTVVQPVGSGAACALVIAVKAQVVANTTAAAAATVLRDLVLRLRGGGVNRLIACLL